MSELIELGLVADGPIAESTGGKPATSLMIDRSTHLFLVIIVRALTVEVALLDLMGATLRSRVVTPGARVTAHDAVDAAQAMAVGFEDRILSACIQSPGVTDGSTTVVESVLMGWYDVPLGSMVEEALGVPTFILNDADAEALAEAARDEEAGLLRLVVRIGEGVGAAVTANGKLVPGATGRAGEIGHVRVIFDGPRETCRCGLSGCLESTTSMTAMLGEAFHDELTGEQVRLLTGTREASERMAFGARALSRALRILSALLDPHEIVIAGSAPELGAHFLDALRDEYELYPAKGTAHLDIRYARTDLSHYLGPARFAVASTLGEPLALTLCVKAAD